MVLEIFYRYRYGKKPWQDSPDLHGAPTSPNIPPAAPWSKRGPLLQPSFTRTWRYQRERVADVSRQIEVESQMFNHPIVNKIQIGEEHCFVVLSGLCQDWFYLPLTMKAQMLTTLASLRRDRPFRYHKTEVDTCSLDGSGQWEFFCSPAILTSALKLFFSCALALVLQGHRYNKQKCQPRTKESWFTAKVGRNGAWNTTPRKRSSAENCIDLRLVENDVQQHLSTSDQRRHYSVLQLMRLLLYRSSLNERNVVFTAMIGVWAMVRDICNSWH